jgi:serine/threonine protein kinase
MSLGYRQVLPYRSVDDPKVGTELAGYRLESPLGQGGMTVVYLAEGRRLERKVALKLLAPGLAADEAWRERLFRESELPHRDVQVDRPAHRLNDPHLRARICPIRR